MLAGLRAASWDLVYSDGTITVLAHRGNARIVFEVSDTGRGIPKEAQSRIFDKFQQVAGQRKGGTGLGLTICKNIVEAHLGKIWVESKLGEGARFIFTIPTNLTQEKVNNQPSGQQ